MTGKAPVQIVGDQLTLVSVTVNFQRTLRIPETGLHPLPPGLGRFPLRRVADYPDTAPPDWLARGGVMLPIYVVLRSNATEPHWVPPHINVTVTNWPGPGWSGDAGRRRDVTQRMAVCVHPATPRASAIGSRPGWCPGGRWPTLEAAKPRLLDYRGYR